MATTTNKPPKTPPRPKGIYTMRVQSGGRITIPVDVRNYFGMVPGKYVKFTIRRNTIYLTKV